MKCFLPYNTPSGNSPRDDRVYVNPSLDLRHIAAVGLDLDHTLAVYDDAAVNGLAFAETCLNLVEKKDYPQLFSDFRYRHSGVIRGLVENSETGDLLKLDYDNRVVRACHGNEPLDTRTILSKYGKEPFFLREGTHAVVRSPFDLATAALFALSVDYFDKFPRGRPGYGTLLGDIRQMLDESHTRGQLKRHILSDLPRFIETRPGLSRTLSGLRSAGIKTFVLTNSGPGYTADLLEHILVTGPDTPASAFFDAIVVNAGKPDFFLNDSSESAPFPGDPGVHRSDIQYFGRASDFERYLGVSGDSILFVGDDPSADCIAAHRCGWRTGMVVPELDAEPYPRISPSTGTAGESTGIWGSVFDDAGVPSRFSRIITENADIYAPCIDHILAHEPGHFFA